MLCVVFPKGWFAASEKRRERSEVSDGLARLRLKRCIRSAEKAPEVLVRQRPQTLTVSSRLDNTQPQYTMSNVDYMNDDPLWPCLT
jgi:hypothetical protein